MLGSKENQLRKVSTKKWKELQLQKRRIKKKEVAGTTKHRGGGTKIRNDVNLGTLYYSKQDREIG